MNITVLIRCREWREHIHRPIPTLLEHLPAITGRPDLTDLREALLPLFKKGRVLLLVDGLDEIHDDGLRSTFVEHLDDFLREYKSTRLVVTSREAGFSLVAPRLAGFCQRWRIAPLEDNAITALCGHWHRLMGTDFAGDASRGARSGSAHSAKGAFAASRRESASLDHAAGGETRCRRDCRRTGFRSTPAPSRCFSTRGTSRAMNR